MNKKNNENIETARMHFRKGIDLLPLIGAGERRDTYSRYKLLDESTLHRALEHLTRASEIFEQSSDVDFTTSDSASFEQLIVLLLFLGQFEKAQTVAASYVDKVKRAHSSSPQIKMHHLQLLASICEARGDFKKAENYETQYLQSNIAELGARSPAAAHLYHLSGARLIPLGFPQSLSQLKSDAESASIDEKALQRARNYLTQAAEIFSEQKYEHEGEEPVLLSKLIRLHWFFAEYGNATKIARYHLARAIDHHPDSYLLAKPMQNLEEILRLTGKLKEADTLKQQRSRLPALTEEERRDLKDARDAAVKNMSSILDLF